jgi:hypothetical protein
MCKRGSIVCKLRPCLPKGPKNSARMRAIVTAALQQQYLQMEFILWICLIENLMAKISQKSFTKVYMNSCHML